MGYECSNGDFNYGDIITGEPLSMGRYTVTNGYALMRVTRTMGDTMEVYVIGHKAMSVLYNEYTVVNSAGYFRKVNIVEFMSEYHEFHYIENIDVYIQRQAEQEDQMEERKVLKTMPTLMNTEEKGYLSDSAIEDIVSKAKSLLDEYGYEWSNHGIRRIMDTWKANKAWIIAMLSKHPNWDAEKGMIVSTETFHRGIDYNDFCEQYKWFVETYVESFIQDGTVKKGTLYMLEEGWYNNFVYNFRYCDKVYNQINKIVEMRNIIREHISDNGTVTEEMQSKLKEYGVTAVTGQKVSKVLNKVFTELGLSKINKTKTIVLPNGETRERKDGYNTHFAALSDTISPGDYKHKLIVSVNPIDYWTMSFGKAWASCHTIDKENKREVKDHVYEGMYSSGTESYMLDSATVIMYIVSKRYDGTDYELQDKIKRCNFHLGEDKIIQGRVYPDGRDGGDEGYAPQMRHIMQRMISECLHVENKWKLKKGYRICERVTESTGTHYRDYTNYGDCTVSFLDRGEDVKRNYNEITIGHNPICPNCGDEHDEENNIMCPSCQRKFDYFCERCGSGINEDDYDAITTCDGEHFCCEDCAREAGYIYCEDDYEWVYEDEVYWDDYEEIYFHNTRNMVCTSDGSYYRNPTNANNAGYYLCEDGEYYHEDTLYTDDYDGTVHSEDEVEPIIMENGKTYSSEENAIADGWVNVNGEWKVA